MTIEFRDDRREVETSLRQEVESLGRIVDHQERTIAALSREVDLHSKAIGWRLQQRVNPLRKWMLSMPVVRQIYRAVYRVLEIWIDEGFLMIFNRAGHKASLAVRGQNFLVEGADRRAPRIEDQYEQWMLGQGAAPSPDAMQAAIGQFRNRPVISVLLCLDRPDVAQVQRVLASLQAQSYGHWELCVAVPPGSSTSSSADLHHVLSAEPRVRTITGSEPSPTYADALRAASGEFIGVITAGDELAPEALFELVKRLNDSDDDIVYSDEDWLSETGRREDPLFKPDWGPDLLLSFNYLERFGIFRRQLVAEIGGFRAAAGKGQVYDLVLRLTEATSRVAHVPKVLYHSHRQPTSASTYWSGTRPTVTSRAPWSRRWSVAALRDERARCLPARGRVVTRRGSTCDSSRSCQSLFPRATNRRCCRRHSTAFARAPITTTTRSSSSTTRARMPRRCGIWHHCRPGFRCTSGASASITRR